MNADTVKTPPGGHGGYSFHGALFRSDILELGVNGFSAWLLDSFGGSRPSPQPGYFQYFEDTWFHDSVAVVADELEGKALHIARRSIVAAVERFSRHHLENGSYIGLFVLISLAEEFDLMQVMTPLARILHAWLPARDGRPRWPEQQDDVLALRETLECAYRQLLACIEADKIRGRTSAISEQTLRPVAPICGWSKDCLMYRQRERNLIPTFAPAYYLAVAQHIVLDHTLYGFEQYDEILRNGAYRSGDANADLYEFSSRILPDRRFPYDIDFILKNRSRFVSSLIAGTSVVEPVAALCNTNDPFGSDDVTATYGSAAVRQNAKELIESLRLEAAA